MGVFGWVFSHKLAVVFIAATVGLGISTAIIAVQRNDLQEDLDACTSDNSVNPTEMPTTTTISPEALDRYRLPTNVKPKTYDLTFYPELTTGLFSGKVVAVVDVQEETRDVRMHSHTLNITKVDVDGKEATFQMDTQFQLVFITLADGGAFQKGERTITVEYKGSMKERIVGLYSSNYVNAEGENRTIATSKFEPTYARQAFPCFDEPNMKAKYTVHILKPKDDPSYIALSNMPQLEKEDILENGVMVHFKESVAMSTYLACFIVCDFNYTTTTINPETDNIPLRVYATPAQLAKTNYALETARGVIEFFIKYFQISYPLPKLDLIAIPDFVSGAMEHWGLVTFRETALLYDPARSSTSNKQRVATVISHELAHSWFGNLVTMNWWSDLWLNEGFASYIEYKGVDAVHKDWKMLDQFIIDDLHPVLSLDSTPASHPIVKTVITPDQITEVFDTITYNKGASILRMLETAVGETVFQAGVTAYLNKHALSNAVTDDLWVELQKIVGNQTNIKNFMDTWTIQMGYPILSVKEDGNKYVITQKRFLKDETQPGEFKSSFGYKWTIPVTYITDKNQNNSGLVWFDHTQPSITIEKPNDVTWIKFNHKQIGYYRVNYPDNIWKLLANNINNMESISDKTHLLEESFSIAESGNGLDYTIPLDLTKYLINEFNYIPWSVASTKLLQLRKYLVDSPLYSSYLEYVVSILTPAYNHVTWEETNNDDHLKRRARITILGLACSMGHVECQKEARTRFQNWLKDPEKSPISQDLRSIIYNYGMREAGKDEWEKMLTLFKNEIDASEKLNLMRGLASVKETWLLQRLIDIGKVDGIIRSQDYFTMLTYVAINPIGTSIVWDYVRENWEDLVARFGLNERYLGRLIPSITGSFTTRTKLKEMEIFFEENPNAGAGAAARKEALANVNNNIKWVANNKAKVEEWIKNNAPTTIRK